MQRLINYGSFLQAYGLKHLLQDMGHEVEFIDIKLKDGSFMNIPSKTFVKSPLKNFLRKILKDKMTNLMLSRQRRFIYEFFDVLGLSKEPNEKTDYDAVVIGSDEVFSYCQFIEWGGTELFFGQGVKAPLIISYAGSFGYTTIENLRKINMDKTISNWLMDFKHISVRDENSERIVKELTGKTPSNNLDPVLIYDFEKLVPSTVKHKNYILVYGYDNRLKNEKYVSQIKAFAKKHKKKILCAGTYQDWADVFVDVNPFEMLAYVKNADYVVCETFHGAVFSIKYQKNFAVIVSESNKNKLGNLIERFGLCERIFNNKDLESILNSEYDKKAVADLIEKERNNTRVYFENSLNEG